MANIGRQRYCQEQINECDRRIAAEPGLAAHYSNLRAYYVEQLNEAKEKPDNGLDAARGYNGSI